jgi:Leucine-rich repeat (LRR) protein
MVGSPDRRAAVWVVSRGGMVTMSGTGTDEIEVKTLADLPSVQSGSKVWKIFLQNARLRTFEGDLSRLAPLKELESLDLIGAGHFSPFAMQSLAGFKELKSLRLADSSIGDEGLAHLHGLTKLEHLAVSNSKITNAGLARLAGMKQLSTLNIGGNDITDEGAATLAAFLKLENLDLTHTSITDQGLERLLMLPELTQLSIGRTRITEAGVKSLGAKLQLTRLALQNLPVVDATLAALEPLGNLEVLDLKGTRVTAAGIERLQKALPECKIEWSAPN